jgi:hypothetical protein
VDPDFCSWQTPKQRRVLHAVRECLREPAGRVRVLDFGVGSLGLYRALDDDLMRRIELLGFSPSQQHDPADPLLARHAIEIVVGRGLSPLAKVPAASQDRVVCSYVFDYLSDPARCGVLHAFARVLRGGGKLLLILHHPRGKRDRQRAMACETLRPIEHPASELALPGALRLSDVVECEDPVDGAPIAHVLTVVRAAHD